jgi:TolA-binding protein
MAKHCTACNRAYAESLEACPYCERKNDTDRDPPEDGATTIDNGLEGASSVICSELASSLPPETAESVYEIWEMQPEAEPQLQPAQPLDAPPLEASAEMADSAESGESTTLDATTPAALEMNPILPPFPSHEVVEASDSAELDLSSTQASLEAVADTGPARYATGTEDFGVELFEGADSDPESELAAHESPAGADWEQALVAAGEPDTHSAAPDDSALPDDSMAAIAESYQAFLARALADPQEEGEPISLEEDPTELRAHAATPASPAEPCVLPAGPVEAAAKAEEEPAAVELEPDVQCPRPPTKIGSGLSDFSASSGVLVRTVASTDMLPENDGVPLPMSKSKVTAAAQPEMPVFPFLPTDSLEDAPERAWIKPGALGVGIGLVTGMLLFWLLGLRSSPANSGETLDLLPLAGTSEPGSPGSQWSDLDPYFRQAITLAEAQRFHPAAQTLQTALKAREKELSQEHDKKNTPEEVASIKAVQANGEELTALWNVEQRLLEEGYLNAKQRDPVAALNALLEGHKSSHESLRSLAARYGSKLSHSAPVALVHQEIDRLLKAKDSAEQEAVRLGLALERSSGVQRLADEARSRLRTVEERLAERETQLMASERKIKELLAAKIEAPRKPAPQAPLLANRPVARDSALAYQHYTQGVALYQGGRFSEAEVEFYWAVKRDEEDARYQYFLGLAQQAQGKREPAAQSFQRGAKLEQGHQPSPVFVALALERARGDGLQILNTYRH